MLEALITSKTRLKLLLKFFLNSSSSSYLRNLETEFGESTNAIRIELNRFEEAGLLTSSSKGNRKYYTANKTHPLFPDINNIVMKYIGLDKIVENVVNKLGDLEKVFVCGEFAKGLDCNIIDLMFVGAKIDREYLLRLVEKVEKMIKRRIRYIVYSDAEFKAYKASANGSELLLLWETA
jgi:hypothetical protein